MSTVPRFSVVIPLFNKRAFIRRAVLSVLRQDLADLELLVVDDGSTDGSVEAIADLQHPRIRIIRQPNGGEGAARNTGIAHACGPWIAFLDADDAWWPAHLSELERVSAAFPSAGLVSTACIEASGAFLADVPPAQPQASIREVDYFLEAARRIGFINSSSVAVRRDVLEVTGGFSAHRAGADLEYWARIALRHRVAVSDRITSAYFRDTGGVMKQIGSVAHPESNEKPRLEDLSPSVAMLCARAREDARLWEQRSIRAYVNARLESGVRGSLYRSHYRTAKGYAELFMEPLTRRQQAYRVLTSMPARIQHGMITGYRQAVGLIRRGTEVMS